MARLDSFLRVVVQQGASDLHLGTGAVPAIRRHGELIPLPFRALSDREARRFLLEVLEPEDADALETNKEIDFVYAIAGVARFRGNVFAHAGGLGAVFRVVPDAVPDADALHLPPAVRALSSLQSGLVVVCGATGAGKTTTVAAIIDAINRTEARHVITIEDPIELVHRSHMSVISQRHVGKHTPSFASAVRAAMRESPDVLVLGELRDAETVELALSAAEGGVLVLGTLHASSAPGAVHRIADLFPDDRRAHALRIFGEQFRAIIAQHLLPARGGDGRIPVVEVLLHSRQTAQLVKDGKVHQIERELAAEGDAAGSVGMDWALSRAARAGLVTTRDALEVASAPEQVRQWIEGGDVRGVPTTAS